MKHTEIINKLIKHNNFKSYLEIGVGACENFNAIECELKESCDPYFENIDGQDVNNKVTYNMTSDEMFRNMDYNKKYDIIFIDGLHIGNQVLKDLWNSLNHISENGYILIHDSLPSQAAVCTAERHTAEWNGTVYKIYPILLNEGIDFFIICDDYGIGVISGNQRFKSVSIPQEADVTFQDIFHNINFDYSKFYNLVWAYQIPMLKD